VSSNVSRALARSAVPLWAGILVPPTAWSLHLLLSYLVVSVACQANWSPLVLDLLLHGLTLVLGAITALSAVLALWAVGRDQDAAESDEGRQRQEFMAHGSLLLSGLFLVMIVAGDIPNFFVPPCR
jgi:hypothetical protein